MTNENVLVQAMGGRAFGNAPDWVEIEYGEFQSISDRANRLLDQAEDFGVAFKKSLSGLESDDLVSFANSKRGGAVLVGVSRTKYGNGRQRAAVVGCAVGDRERMKILARSSQCVPPVPVSIFLENGAGTPFYRIEVPSGLHKPYCTSGGTYKIRGDGRNEMLYPAQLLALFLEAAGGRFPRWFEEGLSAAASRVGRNISDGASFPDNAGECGVRLSSQDLCGFLMRLP
jgi:hypothetical protein